MAEPSATTAWFAQVTAEPLDRAALETFVLARTDGALVSFEGIIRDHDHGDAVTSLDYEAHPDAEQFLSDLCAELATETGLSIAAAHRIGHLEVGDVALVAVVTAAHRADAFTACATLVDRIKERVPIWKRQNLTGGPSEWVGL
ncbi:molybdopterin synthase subunit MoaE2 [soil metagenome]